MTLVELGMLLLGLGAGVLGTGALWFRRERKAHELDDMDQAEDLVNTLDEESFLRLRSAVRLRTFREDRQASGTAYR